MSDIDHTRDCILPSDGKAEGLVKASELFALAAERDALRAENEKLRKDLSMSVFSDSEYCKVLEGEQERLLKSRNRWAQKYNNLLNEKRAEDGYDVYAAAREEYRKKIAEQAAENEKLRAALRDIATGQVIYLPFIQTVARAALGGKDE